MHKNCINAFLSHLNIWKGTCPTVCTWENTAKGRRFPIKDSKCKKRMMKMGRVHPSGSKERQRRFCCWWWCALKSPWQLEQLLKADTTLLSENTTQGRHNFAKWKYSTVALNRNIALWLAHLLSLTTYIFWFYITRCRRGRVCDFIEEDKKSSGLSFSEVKQLESQL